MKLETLTLDGNNISNISALENLTSLKYLVLDSNKIVDISSISNKYIETFSMYNNKIEESRIAKKNENITVELPQVMKEAQKQNSIIYSELVLTNCTISDDGNSIIINPTENLAATAKIKSGVAKGTTFKVNVELTNDIENITVKEAPKIIYIKGENLDLTGGKLTVRYEDGTEKEIAMTDSEVTVTGYNKEQMGNQTLTVTYKEKTTEFNVMVKNDLVNITIKDGTEEAFKRTYVKGEELNLTGGVITVKYEDGTEQDIEMTNSEIVVSGYDKDKVGTQRVTLTYKEFTVSFNIIVKNDVVSIALKNSPELIYVLRSELDLTDGVITVTYEDGSTEDIEMTNSEVVVGGYDKNKLGNQTLTVFYKNSTVDFNVMVKNDVEHISITNLPKTKYIKGEELDLENIEFRVAFESGDTLEGTLKNLEGVVISGYDKNLLGTQTITVEYKGKSTQFEITVVNEVKEIKIIEYPKTVYEKGERLNVVGGKILVTYEDGSIEELDMTNDEISYDNNGPFGFQNPTEEGKHTITVKYKEKTTQYEITVKNDIVKIEIKTAPELIYTKGTELDLSNGVIAVTYESGLTEEIEMTNSEVTVTGYDKNKMGSQTLTVTYKEKTTEMYVTVKNDIVKIEIKTAPELIYTKGTELDLTNGIITATFEDGSSADVEMTDSEVSVTGYEKNKMGSQTLIITYKDKTTEMYVTVKNDVREITIVELPKTTYIKGEEFDLANGKILITYEDGSTEEKLMTEQGVSWGLYIKDQIGKQTITVEYKGKSTQFEVTVQNNIASIAIKNVPELIYIKGTELDLKNATITVTYENGNTEDIEMTNNEVTVTGYDKNKMGNQTLTVTYKEKTTEFNVMVKNDVTEITITELPKTTYIKGEEIDISDGKILVTYEDGSSETMSMTDNGVSWGLYEKDKLGKQTITVEYKGKSTEFEVTVKNDLVEIAIEKLPKETYIKGEELDLTDGKITARYEDGSEESIEMTNSEVSVTGYDKNRIDVQLLIVTYKEKTTDFNVRVKNDVTEVTIIETPKTTYIKGEEFDLTGGKILVKYEDGSSEEKLMTEQGVSWGLYIKDQLGEQTITVEYRGKSAEYTITVIEEFSINFGEYEIKEEENVSYIQNILSNTTKKDLIENIETNGVIEIYKDTEKIENEDTKLATGMDLRITHNNVQRTYKIVVLGDITGDGIIDQLDLLMFARYKAGFEEEVEKVKGANLLATDIVKNNNVAEDIDLLKLARILVELDTF